MPDPYFNSRELHFLNSLALPETGFLLHVNCGAGEGLAQFHELRPRLDLQGIEPSGALRAAFGRSTDHRFSACVWDQDYEGDAGTLDVIYLSGMESAEARNARLLQKHFDRYWKLLVDGGFLLIEVSFADDDETPTLDGEANRVPWLEKNLQKIATGKMVLTWFPVSSKERGILSLQKGGAR
jgi:hypothetical protein